MKALCVLASGRERQKARPGSGQVQVQAKSGEARRGEARQRQDEIGDWSACRAATATWSEGGGRMADGGGFRRLCWVKWRGQVQRVGREKACSAADRSMSIKCARCDDRLKHYKSSIEITSVPPSENNCCLGWEEEAEAETERKRKEEGLAAWDEVRGKREAEAAWHSAGGQCAIRPSRTPMQARA